MGRKVSLSLSSLLASSVDFLDNFRSDGGLCSYMNLFVHNRFSYREWVNTISIDGALWESPSQPKIADSDLTVFVH